jgi:ATP-dependent Clp protease adapter protein ClpS/membrane associated rhomboid family serine protease
VITHRSPENYDPITWFGRVPVYATTIIVALYVVCVIGVAVALASGAEGVLQKLTFNTQDALRHGEIWRCFTYAFVNPPDPWFIIALVMLYVFGRDVEQYLGRKGFVRLYLGFLLLGPSLLLAASLVTGQTFALSHSWANFAVFLAFASLYPNAQLLFHITAKVFAWVFLGLSVLQLLATHQWPEMFVLLATAALAWYAIRRGSAHSSPITVTTSPATSSMQNISLLGCGTLQLNSEQVAFLKQLLREAPNSTQKAKVRALYIDACIKLAKFHRGDDGVTTETTFGVGNLAAVQLFGQNYMDWLAAINLATPKLLHSAIQQAQTDDKLLTQTERPDDQARPPEVATTKLASNPSHKRWSVFVLNDSVNLMSYVVYIFQRSLGAPLDKATSYMLDIHNQGIALVWTGSQTEAEILATQLRAHFLRTRIECISL